MGEPDPRLLEWAATCLGSGASIRSVASLRVREASPWLLRVDGHEHAEVVLKTAPDGDPSFLATEAAALDVAGRHGLRVPALLGADITGEKAGTFALLRGSLDGTNEVPVEPEAARLRQLGAAVAQCHAITREPTDTLPRRLRHMPWKDLVSDRRAGVEPTTALLDDAAAALDRVATPDDPLVLVHGDLWMGNTIWRDGTYVGTIDWDAAGAGSYGVDLGSLRLDTALFYGLGPADEVLAGWEAAMGHPAQNVAYWDLVATLNVEADISGSAPAVHETGRTDLDGPTLNTHRDEFLEDALARLASSGAS